MFTVLKHLYYLIEVTLFTLDLTAMLSGEDQVPRSLAYTENILQFLLICCVYILQAHGWVNSRSSSLLFQRLLVDHYPSQPQF